MKITGIVIMLIGLVGLLFVGVISMAAENAGTNLGQTSPRQDLTIPLVMGLAAFIGGVLLYLFGGREYVVLPKTPQTESGPRGAFDGSISSSTS